MDTTKHRKNDIGDYYRKALLISSLSSVEVGQKHLAVSWCHKRRTNRRGSPIRQGTHDATSETAYDRELADDPNNFVESNQDFVQVVKYE